MHQNHRSARAWSNETTSCIVQAKSPRHQDSLYWVGIQFAQRKGLKFHQTRRNAIIYFGTLAAYCISTVLVMESEEVIYQKVFMSLRPSLNFLHRILDVWFGFRCRWKQQRYPSNRTETQTPIIKYWETCMWTRVHKGNRKTMERCLAAGGGVKRTSLILQDQLWTSELTKVILDAILLILHHRTMSLYRTVSSSTFIM